MTYPRKNLRNVAIVAHVDHGKTTLVDRLLQQAGTLDRKNRDAERIMDSSDQEKERGITILAKNTAIEWNGYRINIIDTPGHADFGGEVERVLSMADSVLLLVDAVDGPMPQTRFVTQKAFEQGLNPVVVVNKIDRDGARPDKVIDEVFDLFDCLGATETQLDFPVIYASALHGYAGEDPAHMAADMTPLFEAIIRHVPPPQVDAKGTFRMQISALDYSSYVGVIGIGRITRGTLGPNTKVCVIRRDGAQRMARVLQVSGYAGLDKVATDKAVAGDIVCVTGIEGINISDTLCDPAAPEPLPPLIVDEPTVSMTFQVNDSPFAGREGKLLTSRNIRERLERELLHNVALRVQQGSDADKFIVSGRGELHLAVLIETMRREGFELGVSRPEVVIREEEGQKQEPFEQVVADVEDRHQGAVMEEMGKRGGELQNMVSDGHGRLRLDFIVPSAGMIGFRSLFLTLTSGSGVLTGVFDHYGPVRSRATVSRGNGVLVSMVQGQSLGYALYNLQDRGRLFVGPGTQVYEGMIIGEHNRNSDLTVNPCKAKQLTNIRAAGSDENIILTPPVLHTLEQALEYIADDELVEVTPANIRLRKKLLKEPDRRKASRAKA